MNKKDLVAWTVWIVYLVLSGGTLIAIGTFVVADTNKQTDPDYDSRIVTGSALIIVGVVFCWLAAFRVFRCFQKKKKNKLRMDHDVALTNRIDRIEERHISTVCQAEEMREIDLDSSPEDMKSSSK